MYIISKEHPIQFVSAFDKLKEQRRKLLGIQEIDNLLNFSDRKNICIVNRELKNNSNNFLYSLFAQFCIDFCFSSKNNGLNKEHKTVLIDAGNGNNLGYIHQNLIEKSIKTGCNINKVLDNTIIVRAFTFYQLANIIINEIPRFMNKIDYNIQILVIDILDTLLSSSSSSKRIKTNRKDNNNYDLEKDFDENANLLDEILDNLICFSDKHFVIVSYNDTNNLTKTSITSKFKNAVEMSEYVDTFKKRKQNKDDIKLQLKIKSINNTEQKILTNNIL